MLDGTPVLDIKPYIPLYDKPHTPLPPPTGNPEHLPDSSTLTRDTPEGASIAPGAVGGSTEGDVIDHTCDDTGEKNGISGYRTEEVKSRSEEDKSFPIINSQQSTSQCPSKKALVTPSKTRGQAKAKGKERRADDVNVLDEELGVFLSKDSPDNKAPLGEDNTHDSHPKNELCEKGPATDEANFASWIQKPPYQKLVVKFTPSAEEQLGRFSPAAEEEQFRLKFIKSKDEARTAITNILEADPRSSYRRQKCVDRLYFFMVDVLHVTCWFNDDEHVAEVVRIKANREKMLQKLAGQK